MEKCNWVPMFQSVSVGSHDGHVTSCTLSAEETAVLPYSSSHIPTRKHTQKQALSVLPISMPVSHA